MKRTYLQVAWILALGGCGVASNPEKGPVVLLCAGENYLKAGNGEIERKHLTQFYKVDGVKQTLETWDEEEQRWFGSRARIVLTPNKITRADEASEMAGITSWKTITIDRVAGRIYDEFNMSNGGVIIFSGACKPVDAPTSEQKF